MSVKCDGCGTGKHVRRAFVILWNGNILDLCRSCMKPLVEITDSIYFGTAGRDVAEGDSRDCKRLNCSC
jgi:hypothetical protein